MREIKFFDKSNFIEDEEIANGLKAIDEQLVKRAFEYSIKSKKYSPKSKKFSLKKCLNDWGLIKNSKATKASILLFSKKLPLSITINTFNNTPKAITNNLINAIK